MTIPIMVGSAVPAETLKHLTPPVAPALVTRPFMPPLDEFQPFLEAIWASRWLTNCGAFHQQLEAALALYLDVEHVVLTSNGTTALLLALQALDLEGEVITTPFTFVATTHALRLCKLRPVFVDIDPATGNLDPEAIERAITPRTSAILPVHCFGHPCDVDRIAELADAYGLKVLYDAAHAFGVRSHGQSILRYGNASALSFHATKVFNTFEGGAIVCADPETRQQIERMRNFGFADEAIVSVGMNGKMNELQAAFGLLQLRHVHRALALRAGIVARYRGAFAKTAGIRLFEIRKEWELNHSYFPILVDDDYLGGRDAVYARLHAAGIYARRYFHPLVSDTIVYRDLPSAGAELPVAREIARKILCLPLYPDLSDDHIERTIQVLGGEMPALT